MFEAKLFHPKRHNGPLVAVAKKYPNFTASEVAQRAGQLAAGTVTLRARQQLGNYRIQSRIADGPLAAVYRAFDTILGLPVALKVPHPRLMDEYLLKDFRKEVRLAARLEHESILPVRHAGFVDGLFVIVTPLGEGTLADRMQRRISLLTALNYAEQALEAVAYAHGQRIIHCDIKPENFILFPGNVLRLGDFGFAKMGWHTIKASGSGTVGYIAPEQAVGRPMFQSDVFSLGLVLYRLFSGHLPEWPYRWPPPGIERMRKYLHPGFIEIIRKAIELQPDRRHTNARRMLAAFNRVKPKALRSNGKKKVARQQRRRKTNGATSSRDWQVVRYRQFQRQFRKVLETHFACRSCAGPVAESMVACPWCGRRDPLPRGETRFPASCPRCCRGVKLDWKYCAWCYGAGFEPATKRRYSDRRYAARCANRKCSGRLMPNMRYCPWCRTKVRRNWKIPGSPQTCPRCEHGIVKQFWNYCPWCRASLQRR